MNKADGNGSTRVDGASILMEVQENLAKKASCRLHKFEVPKDGCRIGQYYHCENCGWKTRIVEIGLYAAGYKAAGGNPDDIMKGIIN